MTKNLKKTSEIKLPKKLTQKLSLQRSGGSHQLFLWAVDETAAGVERNLGLQDAAKPFLSSTLIGYRVMPHT